MHYIFIALAYFFFFLSHRHILYEAIRNHGPCFHENILLKYNYFLIYLLKHSSSYNKFILKTFLVKNKQYNFIVGKLASILSLLSPWFSKMFFIAHRLNLFLFINMLFSQMTIWPRVWKLFVFQSGSIKIIFKGFNYDCGYYKRKKNKIRIQCSRF